MKRRAALLAALAAPVLAQQRVLRLVAPFPAGGAVDAWARILADALAPRLGQPVVVENRLGGVGMLGSDHVARATPDGQTLLVTTDVLFQVPIVLRRPVPAVAPIGRLGHATVMFIIGPAVPASVTDMAGFLAWARGRPIALGHWGAGGSAHALALILAQGERLDATMVGYRGEPPMLTDMLAGRFAGGFGTPGTFGEPLRAGLVRALAVMGAERLPSLPAVPTMAELGLMRDTQYRGFVGLFGPLGLADAVLAPIAAAFAAAVADPVLVERMARMDSFTGHADAAAFSAEFALREAQWREIVARLELFQAEGH